MSGRHCWMAGNPWRASEAQASTSRAYDSFHDFSWRAAASDVLPAQALPALEPQYGCALGQLGAQASSSGHSGGHGGPAPQQTVAGPVAHAIYLCDRRTEDECLSRCLLGLPASQAQVVRGIVPELSLLFLFNVRAHPLHRGTGPGTSRLMLLARSALRRAP